MYEFFIKISLKFVPRGSINNIPELVRIMAWRRPGDKPLSKPMMVSVLTHICVTRPQWINCSLPLHDEGSTMGVLPWRHNERDGISNHQPHDCLLNGLFRSRSKKTPKLRITVLYEGNSPVTREFPAQRASNADDISIWWRLPDLPSFQWGWVMRSSELILKKCIYFMTSHHVSSPWVKWVWGYITCLLPRFPYQTL